MIGNPVASCTFRCCYVLFESLGRFARVAWLAASDCFFRFARSLVLFHHHHHQARGWLVFVGLVFFPRDRA